jgi:tetratricopeptide (TPR) repeat protein
VPLTCLGILIAVFAIYYRSLSYDFADLDDIGHLVENPWVTGGLTIRNLIWDFGIHGPRHWHPLTWLSHQVDFAWFGMNPGLHRAVNVFLHALAAILLFLSLERLTGRWGLATFVGAAFAVHPLNVESVVWIAERSNVLCAVFWMATIWGYERYARRPGRANYSAVVLFHAAALMSKPLAVTLPCVLLLLDFWPLGRLGRASIEPAGGFKGAVVRSDAGRKPVRLSRLILEKVPLFALSLASCVLAVLTQQAAGAVYTLKTIPLGFRMANAVVSYGWYLWKTLWPSDLSCFYPHPMLNYRDPWEHMAAAAIFSGALLCAITILAAVLWRRHPELLVGWLWFLGVIVPMIGVFQIGSQQVADRYAYLPTIGLFIAAGVLSGSGRWHVVSAVAGVAALAGWGFAAQQQITVWRDPVSLYSQALASDPDNHWARSRLGMALMKRGETAEALKHLRRAAELAPGWEATHYNLGRALHELGQLDEAIFYLNLSVRRHPDIAMFRNSLAIALADRRDYAAAIVHLEEANRLDPDNPTLLFNLGLNLGRAARYQEAIAVFEEICRIQPRDTEAHRALAETLRNAGKDDEALMTLERLLKIEPESAEAHLTIGEIARDRGELDRAREHFRTALKLHPGWDQALSALEKLPQAQ